MDDKYLLGLDIGGSRIKAGLVNIKGEIKGFQTIPTNSQCGSDHVLGNIIALIKSYQEQDPIAGIGISLAGSIENRTGTCIYSPNLNWKNVAMGKSIEGNTGIPVRLINDANAACLGEYFFGAGSKYKNIICITIGTGIGSAVILDNKLFTGKSGLAPEAGHMVLSKNGPKCSCGRNGCWETLVSARGILKRATGEINAGRNTVLNEFTKGKALLTITDIFKARAGGDNLAVEIMSQVKEYLALGLANLINIFDPECIVLGGGIIDIEDWLMDGLEDMVKELVFPSFIKGVSIKKAKLGNKAGLVGGASLFLKEIEILGG